MTRRQLLACLSAQAASLGVLRQNLEALAGPNIRWAVSMFLWTSTQWPDRAPVPFTDMLDVIKDTGFDGLRFVGWPQNLDRYGLTVPFLDRELSRRGLRLATLSFHGDAHNPEKHAAIDKEAHGACEFLKHFGATEMVVFFAEASEQGAGARVSAGGLRLLQPARRPLRAIWHPGRPA